MRISNPTNFLAHRFGSLTTAVRMLAEAGFDCYDFSVSDTSSNNPLYCDNWREYLAEVKAAADTAGILCNQAHAPFPSSQPDTPRFTEYNEHIFDRIVEKGYKGSYSTVRRYVRERRDEFELEEMFLDGEDFLDFV
jgi:hypothetical protein